MTWFFNAQFLKSNINYILSLTVDPSSSKEKFWVCAWGEGEGEERGEK
jgi:hypothetical protein